jgi:DNA replication protein DnaC
MELGWALALGKPVFCKELVVTNLVYDEWPSFLGSRPMVEALLSRLRHYCHTVTIDGPSLRDLQG